MSLESERVSAGELGSLRGCLVGGDPEQRSRERRRALVISITTQSAIVAAIVLIPLFAKPGKIAATVVPIPPYYAHRALAVVLGGATTSRVLHPWVGVIFTLAVLWMFRVWASQMSNTDRDRAWWRALRHYIRWSLLAPSLFLLMWNSRHLE